MPHFRSITRAAVIALVALTLPTAAAAVIFQIDFEQYTYEDVLTADNTGPTDLGGCVVDFGVEPATGYLNVAALVPGLSPTPQWIVHNMRLHGAGEGVPEEIITYQFPLANLGVTDGFVVNTIEYSYQIMSQPMLDGDATAWLLTQPCDQVAPVQQVTVDVGQDVPAGTEEITEPTSPAEEYHAPSTTAGADTVKCNIGCAMPNIDLGGTGDTQDVNACMPASCANSLVWLKATHNDIDFPHDKRSVMEQISRASGRNPPNGVHAHKAARAKLDFIEAHKLPIHVKIQTRNADGDIKSTSGQTSCEDKDANATSWPTRNFIMHEASKGEDVEVICTWYYRDTDGKLKPAGMAHALVLTGAGTKAGADYLKLKDDAYQRVSGGMRERETGIKILSWGIELPGLKRKVPAGRPGAGKPARAIVTAVVSESRDTSVTHPGGTGHFTRYCQLIKRTVPKGGTISFTYPDTGDGLRCFNSTLILRQPGTGHDVYLGPWNLNKNRVRSWTNSHNQPMVVMLHNDDMANGTGPYPPYDVGIAITDSTGAAAKRDETFNPEDWGGFSLGGDDLSSAEFGQTDLGPMVATAPIMSGFDLSTVPARLATVSPGTADLLLHIDPIWNPYWDHLGFVLDVLNVNLPGDLLVECVANGFNAVLPISAPGRYQLDMGMMPPSNPWELRLVAQNGLDIELDGIGVPSLVAIDPSGVPVARPPIYLNTAAPNPFNPRTTIKFGLTAAAEVRLDIYDVRGHLVATLSHGRLPIGDYAIEWDGRDASGRAVSSGTYLCELKADEALLTTRMTLVR